MNETYKEFDLHGHTRYSAYPEFLSYGPVEAIQRAREVGLDGIAITGHDTVEGLDEALNEAIRQGVILVPGVEITSRVGFRIPHILGLGILPETVARSKYPIPSLQHPQTVVDWIHDHGGVAIVPHPSMTGNLTSLNYEQTRSLSELVEGIEVITPKGFKSRFKSLTEEFSLAAIGSSDFHLLRSIGLVGTKVFGNIENYQDVIEAIQQKRIEAFFRTDIPPELSEIASLRGISLLLKEKIRTFFR
ncbi:MAG: PHP domain-containing protein [Candidatus Roizmanbacteria bacterium]|nr:PHP domain-containing protein [Candidatus Roizmanbacteria bacterium]